MADVTVEGLRQMVALLGYDWGEEEATRLGPAVAQNLATLDTLSSLELRDVEPAVQYRML